MSCLLGRRGGGDIVQPTSLIYTGFFIFEMTNSSSCRKNVATVTLYIPAGCRLQITLQLALTAHSHWPHLFPLIQEAFYCRQPVPEHVHVYVECRLWIRGYVPNEIHHVTLVIV